MKRRVHGTVTIRFLATHQQSFDLAVSVCNGVERGVCALRRRARPRPHHVNCVVNAIQSQRRLSFSCIHVENYVFAEALFHTSPGPRSLGRGARVACAKWLYKKRNLKMKNALS